VGVGSQLLFQYIDAMRQFPHQRRQFVDHRLPLFERAGLRWRLPDIDLHAALDSTQRLSVSHHLARFSVSLRGERLPKFFMTFPTAVVNIAPYTTCSLQPLEIKRVSIRYDSIGSSY